MNKLFKKLGTSKKLPEQIPQYKMKPENIAQAKLLVDREELLKQLGTGGVIAELGVDEGAFSEAIWTICQPGKLHLVDPWGSKRYNQDKRELVEKKFKTQLSAGQVELNIGMSTELAGEFSDDYFDWIYIDTDHSYRTTIAELESWHSKVKANGVIAGHDYIIGNWDGRKRYGVIEAVYEFCTKYHWEIIYLTMELDPHPSFAIRRIGVN